jgi:hypothetical protein
MKGSVRQPMELETRAERRNFAYLHNAEHPFPVPTVSTRPARMKIIRK